MATSSTGEPKALAIQRESPREVLGCRLWQASPACAGVASMIAEMDSGEKKLEEVRRAAADQLLEQVGRELRALMQTEAPEAHGVR